MGVKTKAEAADYGLGPFSFPRGWFVVAEACELTDKPVGLSFFGKDFVAYRGGSGRVVILDAYCSHMGTHLAKSTSAHLSRMGQNIVGDSIRCPYHGWKYGPDGALQEIPYEAGNCPKALGLRSYPVVETLGCIMMWHCPEQGAPQYSPPMLPAWDLENAIHWQLDHLGEINLHQVELIDNMADLHHLGPTHGAPCEYFENEFRGVQLIQRQGGFLDYYKAHLDTVTWYTGPGLLLSKQAFAGVVRYEFIANTPVEDGVTRAWHGLLSHAPSGRISPEDIEMARRAQAEALETFSADFQIWENKRPAIKVMQSKRDGRFRQVREWVSQFYMPTSSGLEVQAKLDGVLGVKDFPVPSTEARVAGFEDDCFKFKTGE